MGADAVDVKPALRLAAIALGEALRGGESARRARRRLGGPRGGEVALLGEGALRGVLEVRPARIASRLAR